MVDIYEELSKERKQLQKQGLLPEWFTTGGWQMFKDKYLFEADSYYDQIRRIAKQAAKYAKTFLTPSHPYYSRIVKNYGDNWEDCFYSAISKCHLVPSTPVLANCGTDRGSPVSCSGSYIGDSIYDFYYSKLEAAILTKEGFGTSAYLGDIRPRGSSISKGGKAEGSLPVLLGHTQMARDVSQAGIRRGSWAGYLDITHGDFDEWVDYLHKNPQGLHIGWNITDDFIKKCKEGDEESIRRFKKALWTKMQTGKGYFFKVDTANKALPGYLKDKGLSIKASNLCVEITLPSDEDHTFSCVLSSINLSNYDELKDTGAIFISTVFLDCIAEDFIQRGKKIKGLEKVVRFTEKARALGLGALGFHTYFQERLIDIESVEAHIKNNEMFKLLHDESLEASKWMAEEWGEPEWCKGTGLRNTHRTAIAPNMSTAVIAGQISQGIEPVFANVFLQPTSAGEMQRINPVFLRLAQERGKLSKKVLRSVIDNNGSVQHLNWLSDKEKGALKTAFEIDQRTLLRLASARQNYICQGQSLNLYFDADEEEEYIAKIHKEAFLDKNIKGLYYVRTLAGIQAAKDVCIACEG